MSTHFPHPAVLLACLLAVTGPGAGAETLAERLGGIEAALEAGDAGAALEQARDLHLDIGTRAGFGVRQAVLTEEPATGFGLYTPRARPVYAPGTPVYGYVEPFGYSLQPAGQGLNAMLFDIDFALLARDGQPLTERLPMGAVELTSRSRPLDAYFHLTYTINGPAGDYLIWTRVTDRPSGQEAEFTIPVTFREEPAPQSK